MEHSKLAKCRECGAESGAACRDDNDYATDPCDGRQPKRTIVNFRLLVPCQCCGADAHLWGRGARVGRAWCRSVDCQRHKNRLKIARQRSAHR